MVNKIITYFEVFLIVSLSVSLSWTAGNYYGTAPGVEEVLDFVSVIPRVSALDEIGCGYSVSEGTCSVNTPEDVCDEEENCEFIEGDAFCADSRCESGCCTIGLNSNWYTQSECQIQAEREGFVEEFDSSVENAVACFRESQDSEEGACVFSSESDEGDDCTFTTQANCGDGIFYVGKLCSNPELNTWCERQDSVSCSLSGKEVYWFDSCGNRENIYSSDRQGSWNGGNVLKKSESCGVGNDNSRSRSCGNCDYNLGSTCEEFRPEIDDGNMEGYTCRDLNCRDEDGNARVHGESWCVYDGTIGVGSILSGRSGDREGLLRGLGGEFGLFSTDLVGSRHFRRYCNNGEVEVEPCDDYREGICVQNDKALENGQIVDDAICRVNLWEQCLGYNGGEECGADCITKCLGNPDCRVQPTAVDNDFQFATCVPKYPPGFNLGSTSGIGSAVQSLIPEGFSSVANQVVGSSGSQTQAGQVCGLASRTCTSVWKKSCPGGWKCTDNCDCHEAGFSVQMNNLCVSLGDCGVYANFDGKVTGAGASVKNKGKHGKTPLPPFILGPVYSVLVGALGPVAPSGGFFQQEEDILDLPLWIVDPFLSGFNSVDPIDGGSQLENMFGSGLGTTIGAGAVGAVVGTAAYAGTLAASVPGVGILQACAAAGGSCFFNPWTAVAVIIAIAITYALGCGEVETSEVSFECKPWDRPAGGDDCGKCGDDPLKPCTSYRCESLGNRCMLLNAGSGIQECIALEGEDTVPVITPWAEALNQTLFRYEDISNNGFRVREKDGECIQAYTHLSFGVETDVYSQCYISEEVFEYEDRTGVGTFLEGNLFTKNHSMVSFLPSVESLVAGEISSAEELQELLNAEVEDGVSTREYLLDRVGDWNLYVKCGNLDGIANTQEFRINFCVDPGPDKEDPVVIGTAPVNGNVTKVDATSQDAVFFISEPAECRWDVEQGSFGSKLESFNSLANEMDCESDIEKSVCVSGTEGEIICGWMCGASLSIDDVQNDFYVQCRDQPWLYEDVEGERNVGNVFDYTLFRTESELVIDSISPEGVTVAGSEPIMVDVDVATSGGAENGVAVCEWGFDEENYVDRFTDSDGRAHHYVMNQMVAGDYEIFVRCSDFVGNEASASSEFSLELDVVNPEVTRVFGEGGNIRLITDEPSRCFYNETKVNCGFTSENSEEFEGANTQSLSTQLFEDVTYYIKCEDVWGNQPDGCSIIVTDYDL